MHPKIKLLFVSLTIGAAGLGLSSAEAQTPNHFHNIALQKVSLKGNVPTNHLQVIGFTEVDYPLQKKKAAQFKVIDQRSGKIYQISLDYQGRDIDSTQLESNELAIQKNKNGKLSAELKQKIKDNNAQKQISVAIWLSDPGANTPPGLSVSNSPLSLLQQVDKERSAKIKPVVDATANKLRTLGLKVKADLNAPIIHAQLTPQQIERVASLGEVDLVYEDRQMEPTLDVARATVLANIPESQGFRGTGIKVAELEVGGRINTANPYLAGVVQDLTYSCAAWHADAVAGVIRSTHPTVRGIAPGVSLWVGGSCGGWGNELQDRTNAAANWGAQVFNLSLGGESGRTVDGFARFYDDLVINRRRTVVVSAGNSGNGGNVGTPALAYNVIAVGSFDDRNTSNWADDVVSSFSSALDPLSVVGDREKPEVSAPGSNINTTNNVSPWVNIVASGTSFSAPVVSGVVAQMMQANTNLTSAPEAVKAILMTTAVHNIEGNTRLSEIDGAGGIASDRAVNLARNIGGRWGSQAYSCAAATSTDVATFSLTGGVRTRATLVWSNNPGYANYANQPSADLDLQIVNSAGTVVTSSASWDNNYEIVDFTPTTSGTYKLRAYKHRCDLTPKWLGWSWRQGN